VSQLAGTPNQSGWQPQILDQLRRELGDDDGTMIAEIIALYLAQGRKLLGQLTAAAGANDETRVRKLAHSLEGSSLAVGGTGLAGLCQRLESVAHSESPMANALEAVHEEFDRLAGSLSAPALAYRPGTFAEPGLSPPFDRVSVSHDGNRA
jgi:HPt (histidine-containing phosphotransfer) domain-containing protein